MIAHGDVESWNPSAGQLHRRVTGNGESRLVPVCDECRRKHDDELKKRRDAYFGELNKHLAELAMNPTRCKVRLASISDGYNGGLSLKFIPVGGGSEENKRFYAATPGGDFSFVASAETVKALNLQLAAIGSEFYVDFTPATE